jgi:hypothetical protein
VCVKSEVVKETAMQSSDPKSHKVPSNHGHDDYFKTLKYSSENKRLFAFKCRSVQKIKQIQLLYLRLNLEVPNFVVTISSLKPCAAE